MITSAYSRFRETNNKELRCSRKVDTYFIKNHVGSTTIEVVRTEEQLPAVLIFDNKEGVDNVLLYTCIESDIKPGDYYLWRDRHFLVIEEISIVKEIGFKKQRTVECNAVANGNLHVAFVGSGRSYRDTRLDGKVYESSGLRPLVIAPHGVIAIDDYLTIGGYTWRVVDGDTISLAAADYMYLERVPSNTTVEVDEEELEGNPITYAGSQLVIVCDNGLVTSDAKFQIVERTSTTCTIIVPHGLLTFTIDYKQDGKDVATTYIVKGG